MKYYIFRSWAEAMMISDTLQSKKITPEVCPMNSLTAKITIDGKDLETAKTICNGWRAKQ